MSTAQQADQRHFQSQDGSINVSVKYEFIFDILKLCFKYRIINRINNNNDHLEYQLNQIQIIIMINKVHLLIFNIWEIKDKK